MGYIELGLWLVGAQRILKIFALELQMVIKFNQGKSAL